MNKDFLEGINNTIKKSGRYVPLKDFMPGTVIPIGDIISGEGKYGNQYYIVHAETGEHVSLPMFYTGRLYKVLDADTLKKLQSGEYGAKVYQDEKGYARFEFVRLDEVTD